MLLNQREWDGGRDVAEALYLAYEAKRFSEQADGRNEPGKQVQTPPLVNAVATEILRILNDAARREAMRN